MGATFPVVRSQAVSTTVLSRNNLPVPVSVSLLLESKLQPDWNVVLPCIDGIDIIGT